MKRKADGSIDKFKARLVADGNTQKYGIDYDRIFATVVTSLTIRLVLIIAAARDYDLSSLDIRQAYLQAEIKEDLYMRVPPGVSTHMPAGEQSIVFASSAAHCTVSDRQGASVPFSSPTSS